MELNPAPSPRRAVQMVQPWHLLTITESHVELSPQRGWSTRGDSAAGFGFVMRELAFWFLYLPLLTLIKERQFPGASYTVGVQADENS